MPCRCDYEEDPKVSFKKNAEDEHRRACKAQSLVHKLALIIEKNQVKLSPELQGRVKATRKELLVHKSQEHNEDTLNLEIKIKDMEHRAKEITRLGGEPTKAFLESLESFKKEMKTRHQISDEALLGTEKY